MELNCPLCGHGMIEYNTRYWTGMRYETAMFRYQCFQDTHHLEIKDKTMEGLKQKVIGLGGIVNEAS